MAAAPNPAPPPWEAFVVLGLLMLGAGLWLCLGLGVALAVVGGLAVVLAVAGGRAAARAAAPVEQGQGR